MGLGETDSFPADKMAIPSSPSQLSCLLHHIKRREKGVSMRGVRATFFCCWFFLSLLIQRCYSSSASAIPPSSSSLLQHLCPISFLHSMNYTGSILCYLSVHVFWGVKYRAALLHSHRSSSCLLSLNIIIHVRLASFFSRAAGSRAISEEVWQKSHHMIYGTNNNKVTCVLHLCTVTNFLSFSN